MNKHTKMLVAALVLAGSPSPGYAAQAEHCRTIDPPAERLACYDRLHGRLETEAREVTDSEPPPEPAEADETATADAPAIASEPPGVAAPADPATPAELPDQSFGAEQLPSRDAPARQVDLQAVVVSAGEGPTGRRWYRLDGGQLWEQVTPRRTGIGAGDTVEITRSPLGTYHIRRADGSSRSSQVRRRE